MKGIIKFLPVVIFLAVLPFDPALAATHFAGKVAYLSGDASVRHGGKTLRLALDATVYPSDVVVTGESGRVKLSMRDGSRVFIGRNSRVSIDRYEIRNGSLLSGLFHMLWGKTRYLVAKLGLKDSSFIVKTSTASIGVRGTDFIVNYPLPAQLPKKSTAVLPPELKIPVKPTVVALFSGVIEAQSVSGLKRMIKPGQLIHVLPIGTITTRELEGADIEKMNLHEDAFKTSGGGNVGSEHSSESHGPPPHAPHGPPPHAPHGPPPHAPHGPPL